MLAKDIKLHHLFAIGFGTMVGVGWIMLAGGWIETAGTLGASIAFFGGAIAVIIIGLCYGEMGMLFPHSGGEVVYAYEGFGTVVSYAMGWFLVLIFVAACAFEAVSTAWILGAIFPSLNQGYFLYEFLDAPITVPSLIIGIGGTIFLTWLNLRGGKTAAKFQNYVIILFICSAAIFILTGIVSGSLENAKPFFIESKAGSIWPGVLAVLATVPAWYGGFNAMLQGLGEVKNTGASKDFTRLLMITLFAAALFYIGVILSVGMTVSREELLSSELPVASAFFSAFSNPIMGYSVLVTGLLGLITTWNAMLFAGARVLFGLGRARMLPIMFAQVHPRYGSPSKAIIFIGVLGAFGALAGNNVIEPMIHLIGVCFSIAYLVVTLSVLRLRKTNPSLHRPYKVPGYPIVPWIGVLFAVIFLILAVINIINSSPLVVPLEFIVLALWVLLGYACWIGTTKVRCSISDKERQRLIHAK